jgi:hypothetical protein
VFFFSTGTMLETHFVYQQGRMNPASSSILHGQNPEQVLTISGGSASVVAPMDRTTPPKEDKVGTSSVEAPVV